MVKDQDDHSHILYCNDRIILQATVCPIKTAAQVALTAALTQIDTHCASRCAVNRITFLISN